MEIKDVESLAKLARIELSEEEKREILSDMKGILEYVKTVQQVELSNEADVSINTESLHNVWREDKIEPREFKRDLIIGQFPDAMEGFLKVKKIL